MTTELVEVDGHIIDSLILPKILDEILESGADYRIVDFTLGRTTADTSHATIELTAADQDAADGLIADLQIHGVNRVMSYTDAKLEECDMDGVFPRGFYSTTNLPTDVRIGGVWRPVVNPEMDCGLRITDEEVRTVPMHRACVGDRFIVGQDGVRVTAAERPATPGSFEFMGSEISSEKPKGLMLERVAARMRLARENGEGILVVCGPAVVHTGASHALADLVRTGWIDVLFAGNGFATHDIESNVLGTSLGVSIEEGVPTEGGHTNHVRTINEVRRHGSIAKAVEAGYVTGGVMYECVRNNVPFVLGGSVRDDGPLPDVYTNVVEAADEMRTHVPGISVALMLATTLHAIATGNMLPAGVQTYCIDINPAVLTKLTDRGNRQTVGIVTDIGLFVNELHSELTK